MSVHAVTAYVVGNAIVATLITLAIEPVRLAIKERGWRGARPYLVRGFAWLAIQAAVFAIGMWGVR